MRRAAGRSYLICLVVLAVASGIVLLAAGQPGWKDDQAASVARAVGLVSLAGVAATVAVRGRGRRVVGVLLAVAALMGVWTGIAGGLAPAWWPWSALIGCAVVAAVAVAITVLGPSWPNLGSRYQRTAPGPGHSPWEALDRGDDPTA